MLKVLEMRTNKSDNLLSRFMSGLLCLTIAVCHDRGVLRLPDNMNRNGNDLLPALDKRNN